MSANPFKSLENKIKKGINKFGDEVRRGVNQVGDEVKRGVNQVGNEVEDSVKRTGNDVRNSINQGIAEATKEIEGAGKEVQITFEKKLPVLAEKAFDEVKERFVEELPALLEEVALKIAREASAKSIKETLDNAADVIEIMSPTKFTLIFGIELALVVQGEVTVAFSFPNPIAKLTEIRKWANKPPRGRRQIIQCIKDFGPESLSAEFKVSGNGLAAEWNGEDKYDRIDAFLKKHSV